MRSIGEKIRFFREAQKISRSELVSGICDESTLYRIEKGDNLPSIYILEQLCKKLSIPVSSLFENDTQGKHDTLIIKQRCRKNVYDRNFEKLEEELLKLEQALEDKPNYIDQMFLTWHEAILLELSIKNSVEAKQKLLPYVTLNPITEMEVEILNSIGLICLSLEEDNKASLYFENAFHALQKITIIDDPTLLVRVGYNVAYVNYYANKYEETLNLAKHLLDHIENNHLIYMKGTVYHLIGHVYKKTKDISQAINYIQKAITFFKLENKMSYIQKAKQDLNELENQRKNVEKQAIQKGDQDLKELENDK